MLLLDLETVNVFDGIYEERTIRGHEGHEAVIGRECRTILEVDDSDLRAGTCVVDVVVIQRHVTAVRSGRDNGQALGGCKIRRDDLQDVDELNTAVRNRCQRLVILRVDLDGRYRELAHVVQAVGNCLADGENNVETAG